MYAYAGRWGGDDSSMSLSLVLLASFSESLVVLPPLPFERDSSGHKKREEGSVNVMAVR